MRGHRLTYPGMNVLLLSGTLVLICCRASLDISACNSHGPAALHEQDSVFHAGGAQRQAESPAGTLVTRSATPPQEGTPRTAALVDAGLMAGHSFRVGWAPGGRFAHPGASFTPPL